ncbi:MAG: DUF1002 domain-containing protein [Lachnospiraceae bacterium]
MRKKIYSVLALTLVTVMGFHTVSFADAEVTKPYISFGADLTKSEKAKVMELLDVTQDDLDKGKYKIGQVTNKQEHEYLDDYLSSKIIGKRALSSVIVEKEEKGYGVQVVTKNIAFCSEGMYRNALITAGITDANVKVAGPTSITGTAALVGVMQAYENITGEEITEESKDAANNELVVTGELAENIGEKGTAEQLVALIKEKVLAGDIKTRDDILDAVDEASGELKVELGDEDRQKIADLMDKISDLDLNIEDLKQQASDIYEKLENLDVDTKGFVDTIKGWLQRVLDVLTGWLSK